MSMINEQQKAKLHELKELKKQLSIAKLTMATTGTIGLGGFVLGIDNADILNLGAIILGSTLYAANYLTFVGSAAVLWNGSLEKLRISNRLEEQGVNVKDEIKNIKVLKRVNN